MQLLLRESDETSAFMYRYHKQMIDDGHQLSKPILEHAEVYIEAYERELKRINEVEYPRIKD